MSTVRDMYSLRIHKTVSGCQERRGGEEEVRRRGVENEFPLLSSSPPLLLPCSFVPLLFCAGPVLDWPFIPSSQQSKRRSRMEESMFSNWKSETAVSTPKGISRRAFGRYMALATAGATLPFYNECTLAQFSKLESLPA